MLTTLAGLIDTHIPEWKRFHAKRVIAEFASSIRNEMNFQVEGARAHKFRDNFRKDPELFVPAVIWKLTTARVLRQLTKNKIPNFFFTGSSRLCYLTGLASLCESAKIKQASVEQSLEEPVKKKKRVDGGLGEGGS